MALHRVDAGDRASYTHGERSAACRLWSVPAWAVLAGIQSQAARSPN